MRIGINGRFLVAKKTGVQRAAYNLIKTLLSVDRENEYFLFSGKNEASKPEWKYDNVTVVEFSLEEGRTFRNLIWEQVLLPYYAKKYQVDVLHSPANISPLLYRGKSIVHIHDVCFIVNPQWYSFAFRTWYKWIVPKIARRAVRVITNSNNSKNDILQYCHLPVEKVHMIYWAVEEFFLDREQNSYIHGKNKKEESSEEILKEGYILYVGSLEPRKNIKALVEAFQLLRDENPSLKTKLVLIGGDSPLFAQIKLNITQYASEIILKGFVDDDSLKRYYRHASLVAYPSLYEGFGLPPLEAMASGVPVVTSDTSSLPEVVGNAAIKVHPSDVHGLAQSMAKLLKDEGLRDQLVAAGYERVKAFNWYRVVRRILGVYYEVHDHSSDVKNVDGPVYIPFDFWQKLVSMEERHVSSLHCHPSPQKP